MRIPKPRQQAIRLLPFVFTGLFLCAPAQARADVACTPTKPLPEQNRTALKHRVPPAGLAAKPATIADVLAWPLPEGMTRKKRKIDRPQDPKEDQAFVVEGNLWRVKLSEDDCDFHLELGPPGGGREDPRIVVEISQGAPWVPAREALIAAMPGAGALKPHEELSLQAPVAVRVTGYAFCDLQHFTLEDPKRGNGHGGRRVATLWEIHPVWKIEFLKK